MLRLVKIGAEGEGPCTDVMEISRPDDLRNVADLGLTWPKRSCCSRAFNGRSSPRRPRSTPFGG
jgi:hypothetical protein